MGSFLKTRESRWLALVFLLGLALRLGWTLSRPAGESSLADLPDQREYLELARNLLSSEGYSFIDPRFGQRIYAYRAPGYPLFLAACGGSIRVAYAAQAILDAAGIVAVYWLARRWLAAGPSLLAALLVALNPFLIFFSGTLLSETLFTALLVWGMAMLVHRPTLLPGGLLLAFSVLVRPSALALPVLLGSLAALANRNRAATYHGWWRLPASAAMLLLLTFLLLAPWAYRNARVLGRWVWTTTNAGISRYDGLNPDATGASDQSFLRRMPQAQAMDELQRNDYFGELANRFVRENPRRTAELAAVKIARTWSPVPLSADYATRRNMLIGLAYSLPLDVLIVLGLWRGRLAPAAKLFLLLPAAYLTIVHALSVGSLRYRVPAEAPMAVLAACVFAVKVK